MRERQGGTRCPLAAVALAKVAQGLWKLYGFASLIFALSAITLRIVFGEADPPTTNWCYLRRPNEYPRWVLPPPIERRDLLADSGSKSAVYT